MNEFEAICDCHVHIFDDAYPLAATATFKPPHAPVEGYRTVQRELGLSRVVVVQPTGYGFDNSCTLDAMAQLGPNARGVAVVPPSVTDLEIERLNKAGIRGVRFMMLSGGVLPWSQLEAMANRIAPWGWNINLQLNGHDLPVHEAMLQRLPCRLVIDHIGKFLGGPQVGGEGALALHRLLANGNCWVKLSAPYESSSEGPPDFADVVPLARELAARHSERCLWASNWPHPNVKPEPSNAGLMEWALQLMPDKRSRRQILVDNPAELYAY